MKLALAWVAGLVIFVGLCVGAWQGYWYLNKSSIGHQYENNTGTQQYQSGQIADARNQVNSWHKVTDPGQKVAISDQLCAILPGINPLPPDLAAQQSIICTPIQP